jgi:hypothetical protein
MVVHGRYRTTLSKVRGKIQRIRYADNGNELDCDLTDYAPVEGWDFSRNNFRLARHPTTGCLLNLPHRLLKRSSGGSQHHESSSEQKHELQAPRN